MTTSGGDSIGEGVFVEDDGQAVVGLLGGDDSAADLTLGLRGLDSASSSFFSISSSEAPEFQICEIGFNVGQAVFPRQSYGLGATAPDAVGKMVFTFDKIALTRGQVFRVYFYENGGSRNFEITLGPVDINRAKRLN